MARLPCALVGTRIVLCESWGTSIINHQSLKEVRAMKGRGIVRLLVALLFLTFANRLLAQKIKVIVDQDARGPATTDMQSILIFLQSDKFDVLGITTVSGDQWVKEETQRTLRLLEIAGRTDVPVIQGAEFPRSEERRVGKECRSRW